MAKHCDDCGETFAGLFGFDQHRSSCVPLPKAPHVDTSRFEEATSQRASGRVKRWHTIETIGVQTDGEHSFNAVSLMYLLHPDPSHNLIKAMLWHDSAERVAGDVPAPIRRANKALSDAYEAAEEAFMGNTHPAAYKALCLLTIEERQWLKAIDVLELIMFCDDQTMLGNRHFMTIRDRGVGYLRQSLAPTQVIEFLNWLDEEGPKSYA